MKFFRCAINNSNIEKFICKYFGVVLYLLSLLPKYFGITNNDKVKPPNEFYIFVKRCYLNLTFYIYIYIYIFGINNF